MDIESDNMYWIKRDIADEFCVNIRDLDHITEEGTIEVRGGFLCMDGAHIAHIACIIVEEEHRGKGLCRELIDLAIDEFGEGQFLTLRCRPALVPLYEHLGFVVDPSKSSMEVAMIEEGGL